MKEQLFLDVGVEKIDHKYILDEKNTRSFKTTHYLVSKDNQKQIKKELGDYFVIEYFYENLFLKKKEIQKEVEKIFLSFFKKYAKNKKVLIIGLGNNNVLADSLGIKVTDSLIATNQYHDFLTIPKVALFNPSVTEKTGINSFKLIEMVVNDLKPDLIIIIDSLMTNQKKYLNKAIEINDTGIIPSKVLNSARSITKKTFNIPVLAVGIPLCLEINKELYTTTTLQEVINTGSEIISNALNNILF